MSALVLKVESWRLSGLNNMSVEAWTAFAVLFMPLLLFGTIGHMYWEKKWATWQIQEQLYPHTGVSLWDFTRDPGLPKARHLRLATSMRKTLQARHVNIIAGVGCLDNMSHVQRYDAEILEEISDR